LFKSQPGTDISRRKRNWNARDKDGEMVIFFAPRCDNRTRFRRT
jgi:hypothetical protein